MTLPSVVHPGDPNYNGFEPGTRWAHILRFARECADLVDVQLDVSKTYKDPLFIKKLLANAIVPLVALDKEVGDLRNRLRSEKTLKPEALRDVETQALKYEKLKLKLNWSQLKGFRDHIASHLVEKNWDARVASWDSLSLERIRGLLDGAYDVLSAIGVATKETYAWSDGKTGRLLYPIKFGDR